MKKPNNHKRGKVSKSIVFSIVFLVLGFILAYSYSLSQSDDGSDNFTANSQFEKEESFREELIEQQERNKTLREEMLAKQEALQEFESAFSAGQEDYSEIATEAEKLRRYVGLMPVEGEGLKVILEDGEYGTQAVNPNEYIVHESHVFQVIHEMYISGAEAVAINGQRIHSNSTIVCTGPVIEVDGIQHPAPFTIEAIGKPDVLAASLELPGGVLDQLVNDNVVVTMAEGLEITMPALLSES
ncbi:DUF881 domain-containing protein [Planomicrobium sp. Y74]|uniref:DUF881 domain-containing protein n=1 Tax=Planomicrobium sp. Y74 TaxID=2478977 RepID=UPI000EF4D4FF|nr:DUF881 domain-containing protein [Planomicrobium sp. Y74]RLQ92846.1 DUF881 domain-containing protein [Planomicrobium sp. Y74]